MADGIKKRAHRESNSDDESQNDKLGVSNKRAKVNEENDMQPCHFFKLPRELRDMVYHLLWEYTPLITDSSRDKARTNINSLKITSCPMFSIAYNAVDDDEQCCLQYEHLPRWLLVNKTFLDEGLNQLRSKGKWDLRSNRAPQLMDPRKGDLLEISRVRSLHVRISRKRALHTALGQLANNTKLRHLTLSLDVLELIPNHKDITYIDTNEEINSLIAFDTSAFACLAEDFQSLRTLTVGLDLEGLRFLDLYPDEMVPIAGRAMEEMRRTVEPIFSKCTTTTYWPTPQVYRNEHARITFKRI